VLLDFSATSSRFKSYITYEVSQGDFFADAPIESLQKTADCVAQTLFAIQQLILSLTIPARTTLLTSENQRRITESLDRHKEISVLATSSTGKSRWNSSISHNTTYAIGARKNTSGTTH